MSDLGSLTAWIDGYLRAWNSNDPADIGGLFTADAAYHPAPFGPSWRGRQQIVDEWLKHRDEPGETTFTWQVVARTDDVAIVQGETAYPSQTYSNLWVIQLDGDGRCAEFTEWWMEHPTSSQT